MKKYVCPICGNKDPKSIGILNGVPYCRKCIAFKSEGVAYKRKYPKSVNIYLNYELSPQQKDLSNRLVNNYFENINSLVYAVCGSGKTEIVLEVIRTVLSKGMTVGFVIPRRDVVIEIGDRLKEIFKDNEVVTVYGHHNDKLEGDIIVLTSHQLYRYPNYFDLLIIDEIDAFPFKGDEVLQTMFKKSVRGNYIKLTATPSDDDINEFTTPGHDLLKLFNRFHGDPLPVPVVEKRKSVLASVSLFQRLNKYKKQGKPVFVFCPTIELCEKVYDIFKNVVSSINYVHSKKEDRDETIKDFKSGKIKVLITTSVLERGVTVKDLQVVVMYADHPLYDKFTLIQIAGRVGRKIGATKGEVIFVCEKETKAISNAIKEIKIANESLYQMF